MKSRNPSALSTSLGAFLMTTAAGAALAQAPVGPSTTPQDINRANAPSRDGENKVTTLGQGDVSLCPFATSEISVTINSVVVSGNTVLSQDTIDKAGSKLRGAPTKLSAVCEIRNELIDAYRAKGYPLTRVELPEQRITSDGVLKFVAVEAGLRAVEVTDNAKSAPFANIVDGYAARLRATTVGEPLKWAQVERFALLMRETPGVVARLELRPGAAASPPPANAGDPIATPSAQAPLDLYVSLEKPDRFAGFYSLQRNSADVFGRYAGVVGGQMRGVMPWGGDELSGALFSTQTGRQAVGLLSYEWRHGSGLALKGSAAYAETKPGRTFAPLDLKGQSTSFGLNATYPFLLRSSYRLEGSVGLEYVDQDNFIFEDDTISNDKIRIGTTKLALSWRDIQQRRANASAWVEYRNGLESFDATVAGDPLLSRVDANPQAESYRIRAQGEFRLRRDGPGVSVAGDAQIADEVLVSFEQYQVGNLTFGRGYDPGTIVGDRGYGGRVEVMGGRFAAPVLPELQFEPYTFYDATHVESLSASALEPERNIDSWGAGLRLKYAERGALDIGFARGLDTPARNQKKPGPQFLMNLIIQF